MIKSLIGFIGLFLSVTLQAQTDSVSVRQLLAEKGGYTALIHRLDVSDTTLTIADFTLIYYGYQTTPEYYSIENAFKEDLIKPLNRAGQYKQAIELADSILLVNPVSIVGHFEKAYACAQLGMKDAEAFHSKRYILFCNIIKQSGNGSIAKPYACNSTNDAVEFLSFSGLTAVNDRKTDTGFIEFDLAKNKQKVLHVYCIIPAKTYTPPDTHPDSEY